MSQRGLWHNHAFLTLWAGETISLIGSAVTMLALPLTAILLLHASPWQLGALIAIESATIAVFSLFAGAWSDRARRRPLMIAADIIQAVLIASVPLAAALGVLSIAWLYVVVALTGVGNALFSTSYQAFVPTIVATDDLVTANGRMEGSRVFAQVIGPGLAGALIQLFQAPFALLVDAASFLASAVGIGMLRSVESAPPKTTAHAKLWRDISQGLRFTFTQSVVRDLLLITVIFNFFAPMLNAQLALFAIRDLGLTPLALGLGIVAASVCGVLVSLVTSAVTKRLGMGPTMVMATLFISSGWLIAPTLQRSWSLALPLLALGAAIGTAGDVLFNINAVTVRQLLTPDHLRGRVSASMRVFILGAQPIGALVGGAIGVAFSERIALLCAGSGFLLGFLAACFSSLPKLRQAPESLAAQPVSDDGNATIAGT